MIATNICLQLALHLTACEKALEAFDAQYKVLEPLRKYERALTITALEYVDKRTFETVTFLIGPTIDWQQNQQIKLAINISFR
jgi:hypothetical protein